MIRRSRGGLTTKIHLAADLRYRPAAGLTSPGQHDDSPYFTPLMDAIRVQRRGLGRPRRRPGRAMAGKAYSSRANYAWLRRYAIKAVIPVKEDQKSRAVAAAGRPHAGLRRRLVQETSNASASSSSSAPWPPVTTSASASTRAPSMLPRSASGCATLSHDPRDTP